MLAYGVISFISLRKEKKIDTKEIDKEIIRKIISLFIKGFFLNIINIGVLGFWLAIIISIGPKLDMQTSRMVTFFSAVIILFIDGLC
jgi:threonine/homoserine/homoserine lactone efflux protein